MKNTIKTYFAFTILSLIFLTGCEADFMDTSPENKTSPEQVFKTTENAKFAINGLAKIMTRKHLGDQGFNGEGTIKMYYGNYPGESMSIDRSNFQNTINGTHTSNNSSKYTYYPWHYYYQMISNANIIIDRIGDAEGSERQKSAIRAQALAYRGYSYFMLIQLYGDRWVDSNNGSSQGVVLRLEPNNDELPLSSLGEVYDQVYSDFSEALDLFETSNYERQENYEIDKQVVQAMYARAAITKQDYELAEKYAEKARQGFPLMGVDEYNAGFANPTSEWIWSSFASITESLDYYSFQAYIAYNSNSANVRNSPRMISKELFESLPSTDIRRDLFLDPENYSYNQNNGRANNDLEAKGRALYPDIQDDARIYAYMQFKFVANDLPGVGHLNHFRSSEMLLIEAEAAYFLNKEDKARDLLMELNAESGRDSDYTVSVSGEPLFEEIKKYRAIELWGEGFDWFDLKRWKDTRVRKGYPEGGNFLALFVGETGPSANNSWRYVIPLRETDNNKYIN